MQRFTAFVSSLLFTRRLLVVVLLMMIFTIAAQSDIDEDFWWHLRTGQYIIETGIIPRTDPFSFTKYGQEWVTHEWLAEVFIYWLYRLSGWVGLTLGFSSIVTVALWIAYLRCEGPTIVKIGATFLGALATGPIWGVRPQIISFLFTSVFIAVLGHYARGGEKRFLWWLVPLMILWVNCHGAFALGLALIMLTVIGIALDEWAGEGERNYKFWRRARPLILLFVLCVLTVPLNPSGMRLYSYPLETLSSPAMQAYIEEWHSPDFHQPRILPLLALMLTTFASLALSRKRVRPGDLFLLLVATLAVLRSGRHIPLFVLIAVPLLAEHAWSWISSRRWCLKLDAPEKPATGAGSAFSVAFLLIALALSGARVAQAINGKPAYEARAFPAAAVEFMRAKSLPRPVFNSYNWGGYLIWKLHPDYQVYVDGRADVYGDALFDEYVKAYRGGGVWRETLDRRGINTVVIEPDTPLATLLREGNGWRKEFEDRQAVIFVRQ